MATGLTLVMANFIGQAAHFGHYRRCQRREALKAFVLGSQSLEKDGFKLAKKSGT